MARVSIKWKELDKFVLDVRKTKKARAADIIKGMQDAMLVLNMQAQKHLRGGNPLYRGTGELASHVKGSTVKVRRRAGGQRYVAEFGVIGDRTTKGPGFYGRVLEWGAQTPNHIVKPKPPKKFLVFRSRWKMGKMKKGPDVLGLGGYRLRRAVKHGKGTGHLVFAKQVRMTPKPWLTPAFKKMRPRMIKIIEHAGGKVVEDLSK